MRKIAVALSTIILVLGIATAAYAKPASNPNFPTREEVRQWIATAVSTLNTTISGLTQRVTALETKSNDHEKRINDLEKQVKELQDSIRGRLLGYWKMDDTDTTVAVDSSGLENNGAVSGTSIVSGKFGQARQFDGTDDIVVVNNSSSLTIGNTGSVALWVKTGKASGQGFIDKSSCVEASQCGYSKVGFAIDEYADVLGAAIGDGTNYNAVEVSRIDDNQWHFLVLRWDGSNLDFFIDSAKAKSTAQTITPRSNGPIHIGFSGEANGANGNGYVNGLIDEARVYSRALSDSEIISLYQSNEL